MKHVAACSFGKDSIATVILAREHNEPLDEVMFNNVQKEEGLQRVRIPLHAEKRRGLHGGRAARIRRSADNAADALFGDGLPALRLSNPAGDSRPPRNHSGN